MRVSSVVYLSVRAAATASFGSFGSFGSVGSVGSVVGSGFVDGTVPSTTSFFPSSFPESGSFVDSTVSSTTSFGSFGASSTSSFPITFPESGVSFTSSTDADGAGFKTVGGHSFPIDYSPKTKGGKPEDVCTQSSVRTYNIDISDANMKILNTDVSVEEYVPCNLITDYGTETSKTYTGCGCRYKGAVGSLLHCLDPKTGRPSGHCRKLSLKVDSNMFREDKQKIDGMKKLNFHGMAVDKSLVSERLAYNLIRRAGVASPCSTHAKLYLNGKLDGVRAIVQDPESGLTEEFFGADFNEGDGALYKDYWFRPEQANREWLEEHHDGKDEHNFMLAVTAAINSAPKSDYCSVMETYFDLDTFAKITAINDMIGQTDDWRIRHNFNWYVREDQAGKKLVMIPWDYDRLDDDGLGVVVRRNMQVSWTQKDYDPNSYTCLAPQEDPILAALPNAQSMEQTIRERINKALPPVATVPIQCDKVTRMLATCMNDKVKKYFVEYQVQYPSSTLNAWIDYYVNQIQSTVALDDSVSSQSWTAGVQSLKTYLRKAPGLANKMSTWPPTDNTNTASSSSSFGTQFSGFQQWQPQPSFQQPSFGFQQQSSFGFQRQPSFGFQQRSSSFGFQQPQPGW